MLGGSTRLYNYELYNAFAKRTADLGTCNAFDAFARSDRPVRLTPKRQN